MNRRAFVESLLKRGISFTLKEEIVGAKKRGVSFILKEQIARHSTVKPYIKIRYPVGRIESIVRVDRGWKTLETGEWEPESLQILSDIVRNGDVVLDVGAWIGPFTLLLSHLVGPSGRVHAFEPDPTARAILYDNVMKNGYVNVKVEHLALSNTKGKARLSAEVFGQSESSILPHGVSKAQVREIAIETTTLDDYCRENRVIPNGLKIDVEGAEDLVIEGSRGIIETYHPWMLVEFHSVYMEENERERIYRSIVKGATQVMNLDDPNLVHPTSHILLRY